MSGTDKTGFDCILFKREAQERIFAEIKDKSVAEQISYFRDRSAKGPLGEWRQSVKKGSLARKKITA
jgi:hypothetical protein